MKLSSPNINVMIKSCLKASKVIIRDFGEIEKLQVSLKGPGDFVTTSDKKVEEILIDELSKARPNYQILSEESGAIEKKESEFKWVIDPIDGTFNFLHGVPHFCISVALEKNKEIIAGVIYDPIKDELFAAEKGEGSYLNNYRMRVSGRNKLENSLIFTGFPKFNSLEKDKTLKEFSMINEITLCPIRILGSAALDMAYVAAGRCDGYWQRNLNYWDYAAGIILVKEAGGFVTDFEGGENFIANRAILATNSKIGSEIIKVLKK
ncbi:MAG: inositol monophosphatase [Candidatus Pelagibacter sp. TMED64]|nr:inositol monophosphatase [Candidatus Pelagibacter sp.]OUU65798.1 MAG: inositol monophosphatase [Candidatus Pelagibacter sp. TMED64]|tara:strand:- start:1622 stop:2413 length:792 start_codon:yes stop_codon:yes gene_type:complete